MKKNIQDLLKQRKKKFKDQIIFCNDFELLAEEVCTKLDLKKTEVKKVIDAQFRMLKQVINNEGLIKEDSEFGDFKSIRLMLLGSFRPSEKKFNAIKKNALKKTDEKEKDKK